MGICINMSKHKCTNLEFGFNCVCKFVKSNPGTKEYSCEWCGLYTASKPCCTQCEEITNE
jgi:hypothetical protein